MDPNFSLWLMSAEEMAGGRDASPERRRSSVSVDHRVINRAKEIAAEARELKFLPVPLEKLRERKPPSRTTTAFVDKLPAHENRRTLTALSVVEMFFSGPTDLWQAIAQSANDRIRTAQVLGQNPAYGPRITSTEVRLVFFLRLRLTVNPGTSLREAYMDLALGRYMSFDRFVFISSQAALSPDTLCEVIRYARLSHRAFFPTR